MFIFAYQCTQKASYDAEPWNLDGLCVFHGERSFIIVVELSFAEQ